MPITIIIARIVMAIVAIPIVYLAAQYLIYCLSDEGDKPFPKNHK